MMLTNAALPLHVKKKLSSLYVLSGDCHYLQEQSATLLKNAFHPPCETRKITLQNNADWECLLEEANSYSLFSEYTCLQAWLDKKTLDATAKKAINTWLAAVNPKCLVLLHAPEVPYKQWQWLEKQDNAVVLKITPLQGSTLRNWIIQQLNHHNLAYEPEAVDVLQQYTEGNQQACVQALEKLSLLVTNETLTGSKVAEQIMDQSEWQIFDLSQACLQANASRALTILKQARETRVEITLILWVLSQEVRLLARLLFLVQKGQTFRDACSLLKIWNTRITLYQQMHRRMNASLCDQLLKTCKQLDEDIKTGRNQSLIWQTLESIALSLCLGEWRKACIK